MCLWSLSIPDTYVMGFVGSKPNPLSSHSKSTGPKGAIANVPVLDT